MNATLLNTWVSAVRRQCEMCGAAATWAVLMGVSAQPYRHMAHVCSRLLPAAALVPVVDIQSGSTANSAPVIQWPNNGGTNQQWQIVAG